MSLDDLRAEMHAVARQFHEIDVDVIEAERDFRATMDDIAVRRAALSEKAHDLAVALQNYQPDEPPQPAKPIVRYARMLHEVDRTYSIPTQEQRYSLQVIQGDQWHMDQLRALRPGNTLTLRASTPVARRSGDKPGDATCLPFSMIRDEWMMRDANGNIIGRERDGDQFVDIGNPDYRKAVAEYLPKRLADEGVWGGVWIDEINADPRWSYPNAWPVKLDNTGKNLYATPYRYQVAIRGFVNAITPAFRAAGLQVWINLAGDYDDAWTNGLAHETDGHTIEFFLARYPHETGNTANGYFQEALAWVQRREAEKKQGFYNAQTVDPVLARYALSTVLLAAGGTAVFGAGVDGYPVSGTVWTADMDNARKLGPPLGAHRINSNGLYVRDFEHGTVYVNPAPRAVNTMPATSGLIELR